jgi:hypothetical protein
MDLKQRKLNKSEWDSIEIPVSSDEIEVLNLIIKGYSNVNIKYNKINSLFTFLKIEYNKDMEDYLYFKYFSEKINTIIKKYNLNYINQNIVTNPQIKKADAIRLQKNTVESIQNNTIYENILIDTIEKLIKNKHKNTNKWSNYYYTLYKLIKNNVIYINRHIMDISNKIINQYEEEIDIPNIIYNAIENIEKNEQLLKCCDMSLYGHQKELFTVCKNEDPKLILYITPTGTGKTMSPIGLSEKHKIIFVCAARHVGLALARAAISVNKKIAFAFGCGSATDIRLHYFSAKEITKNRKTGGIWKVDNSVGDKVEIMICDIKSYLPAMYYMMAFNEPNNIITYWDEPTITLDYEHHEFHEIIHKNWSENKIPNVVLSSATLPKVHELNETISDFKSKFNDVNIYSIVSHDCKKSIPIINKDGFVVLPHHLDSNHENIINIVNHCDNYLTLMRYFDLKEVVQFIYYVYKENYIPKNLKINRYFTSLNDVDMLNIKLYYLKLLRSIDPNVWEEIYDHFMEIREKRILSNDSVDSKGEKIKKSSSIGPGVGLNNYSGGGNSNAGLPISRIASEQIFKFPPKQNEKEKNNASGNCAIYVTTKDAFTLTDGPTIFLANDVEKIAKFCIQQANIPAKVMEDIVEKINYNNNINEKIEELEREIEYMNEGNKDENVDKSTNNKKSNEHKLSRQLDDKKNTNTPLSKMMTELEMLKSMIKITKLNDTFIPNTIAHLKKWAEDIPIKNSFTSDIDDETIVKIMMLKNVEDSWKVLLLMGIGVFTNHESIEYTEIMKNLADQQKLYMIIASSDYIYGTNYQFCHGYLSKDMNLTQEKIIQAMGRIGRNKFQQEYTLRFRDDEQIQKLFTAETEKPEIINMNRLFVSDIISN